MEIFTKEFKKELSKQLDAITFESKKEKINEMLDFETLQETIGDCFSNNIKVERNKNNKKFELEDVVYLGNLQGIVEDVEEDLFMVGVKFINGYQQWFKNNGRLFQNSPKVLSHYPYELKKKKSKH